MRVAFDATPIAGSPTGIGAFTHGLLDVLRSTPDVELATYGLTARGQDQLRSRLSPSTRFAAVPVPASVLLRAWSKFNHPRITSFVGDVDIYHGTNFVVPPVPRSTGSVVTVHDLTSVVFPEMCTPTTLLYPGLIQRAIDRGAFVHTPTEAIAKEVREHFEVDAERVVAIHHGLNPVAAFTEDDVSTINGDYLLAVGTIEPRKDYVTLVKAFDSICDQTQARLVIAGAPGWRSEEFDIALEVSRNRDRINVLGYVDNPTRNNLMRNATALIYPSIYEGFGLPPLEAMQWGVPVVATDIPAVAEVVGEAAKLVPSGDVGSLASAMRQVLDDTAMRSTLIEQGMKQVNKFTWTKCASQMIALYRKAAQCR